MRKRYWNSLVFCCSFNRLVPIVFIFRRKLIVLHGDRKSRKIKSRTHFSCGKLNFLNPDRYGFFFYSFYHNVKLLIFTYRGEWAALGQSPFFKKYEEKNLEFYTWSCENDFGNLCPSQIEKIGFPFFKKRPHFPETKINFLF